MKDARTTNEVTEALDEMQATLDLLVAHLGLSEHVEATLSSRRAKAERSRVEIERSLGHAVEHDGDRQA